MSWKTVEISSWNQYLSEIAKFDLHSESNPAWIFRGQSDVNWRLIPSFSRHVLESVPRDKALGIEWGIFRRFVSQAHMIFDRVQLPPDSDYPTPAWWILMQHYSCPTRMLDWTDSPFVALYFGINQNFDNDGVVYGIASSPLDSISTRLHGSLADQLRKHEHTWTTDKPALFPVLQTLHSERSVIQQGCYTISTDVFTDHGRIIEECFVNSAPKLLPCKFIIKATAKRDMMAELSSMNITAASLFPGADGLGRYSSEYVMNRVWQISKTAK